MIAGWSIGRTVTRKGDEPRCVVGFGSQLGPLRVDIGVGLLVDAPSHRGVVVGVLVLVPYPQRIRSSGATFGCSPISGRSRSPFATCWAGTDGLTDDGGWTGVVGPWAGLLLYEYGS